MIDINLRASRSRQALSNDYAVANQTRLLMRADHQAVICLLFDDVNNKEAKLFISAQGPQLYVRYFSIDGTNWLSFGSPEDIRYHGREPSLSIENTMVSSLLNRLKDPNGPRNFSVGSLHRNCLLLVILLASEIVRNELLCELYLKKRQNDEILFLWQNYTLLYQNWNDMSKTFYRQEYQRIMVSDCRNAALRADIPNEKVRDTICEALRILDS